MHDDIASLKKKLAKAEAEIESLRLQLENATNLLKKEIRERGKYESPQHNESKRISVRPWDE